MSKSEIKQRRDSAEELVKEYWGEQYDERIRNAPPVEQLTNRLEALVTLSAKEVEIELSETMRDKFIHELREQAVSNANRTLLNYIHIGTRRGAHPRWGAIALNSWLNKEREKEIKRELETKEKSKVDSLQKSPVETSPKESKLEDDESKLENELSISIEDLDLSNMDLLDIEPIGIDDESSV